MSRVPALLALIALTAPQTAWADRPAPLPDPLPPRAMEQPMAQQAVLSNGLPVLVVHDPRAPLVELRLASRMGPHLDPAGKEGLASAVYALATAGTAERDADTLSGDARRLGVRLHGGVEDAGGEIRATGLARNLAETVEIWASTVRAPIYPQQELDTWRADRLSDLAQRDRDPGRIATKLWWQLVYGDRYLGPSQSVGSIEALTVEDLRGWHQRWVGPSNSLVLVGGDVTLEQIVPLLEEHLGDWRPEVRRVRVDAEQQPIEEPVLYLVDHPGASQSHIRSATRIGPRTDPGHFPLVVGNHALGGAFTSRVNLNLREDKGYTYGARCWLSHHHGDGQLGCSTSVQTAVTAPAIAELRSELEAVLGDRPLTDDEVDRARAAVARRWPAQLETVAARLDREREIWQYGLPHTWLTDYVGQVTAVTTTGANEAIRAVVSPEHTFWLVVGDAAVIRSEVETLGLPVVLLDIDGRAATDAD